MVEDEPCELQRCHSEETTNEIPDLINAAEGNLRTKTHEHDIATCSVSEIFIINVS